MLVMKFGGTSLGHGKMMVTVGDIVREVLEEGSTAAPLSAVVVVSAMSGVTDALLSAARSAGQGKVRREQALRNKVNQVLSGEHNQRPPWMLTGSLFGCILFIQEIYDDCLGSKEIPYRGEEESRKALCFHIYVLQFASKGSWGGFPVKTMANGIWATFGGACQ